MKRLSILLTVTLLLASATGHAQKTGEIFSPAQLVGLPMSQVPKEKAVLPLSGSLKSYCPIVANQNGGTCFAYSSAYAGRTILYNATLNNTRVDISSTFSPGYLVRILQPRRRIGNRRCSRGASTIAACRIMEREGVVPINFYPDE